MIIGRGFSKMHHPKSDLPVQWKSSAVAHFEYKSAAEFVEVLNRDVKKKKKCACKCVCNDTPYGHLFAQIERALGHCSPNEEKRFAARCIIRDTVCYKENAWEWIEDKVIFRMVTTIAMCRYDRIFSEMLKFNPLIMIGKGILYAILRYGTYGMMEAVLDLCDPGIVDMDDYFEDYDDNTEIPNNIMPIVCEPPNDMSSDAGDYLSKFRPMIDSAWKESKCSVGLKLKDSVILMYGSSVDEVLNSRKRGSIWDRQYF
jgi:hypothetical protein